MDDDTDDFFSEQAWEQRYRAAEQSWSGNPNAVLVTEASALTPGTALDAGAGEGADACWLAERGWRVTGIDISTVALERAAARAKDAGVAITWQHLDLTCDPAPATYDLVSAFFLHMPRAPRELTFARLAEAVTPGGRLLVVGHDFSDLDLGISRPHLADSGWTATELAASLRSGWVIEVAEARPREGLDHEGHQAVVNDTVVLARRV